VIQERSIKPSNAFPVIQKLTEIRLAWELKPEDLAQRIGCGRSTFMHWESGASDPSLKALTRWASILGYELSLKLKERS
jgi:transcriptional regulator with XRE-family HTH domain